MNYEEEHGCTVSHWWYQDGPWTASCDECGADARIVLVEDNEEDG